MKTSPISAAFILSAGTDGTGGNCMADLLLLKNGKAIVLTDECVSIFDDPTDFLQTEEGSAIENARDMLDANGEHVTCARIDNEAQRSPMGLTFVERIGTDEPDGPVSTDLIVLADGRVLGLDDETLVLYPSIEAFNTLDGNPNHTYPTLDVEVSQ